MHSPQLTYTVPRRGLQSNGVQRSSVRSGCIRDAHEGGQGRDIRAVVGEEEAIEHSLQEQHDHQYHEHQW